MIVQKSHLYIAFLLSASLVVGCEAPIDAADIDADVPVDEDGETERFSNDSDDEDTDAADEADELPLKNQHEAAANLNLAINPVPFFGDKLNVSWESHPDDRWKVCWEVVDSPGSICSNNSTEIAASDYWSSGHVFLPFSNLSCQTEYEFKVRRKNGWPVSQTGRGTTTSCCSDPCPEGGYYDGANCQIGEAPEGTTAFIWEGNYYYSALPGDSCPYPGSWFDGANCFVQAAPQGSTPFIWDNHWYYEAICP